VAGTAAPRRASFLGDGIREALGEAVVLIVIVSNRDKTELGPRVARSPSSASYRRTSSHARPLIAPSAGSLAERTLSPPPCDARRAAVSVGWIRGGRDVEASATRACDSTSRTDCRSCLGRSHGRRRHHRCGRAASRRAAASHRGRHTRKVAGDARRENLDVSAGDPGRAEPLGSASSLPPIHHSRQVSDPGQVPKPGGRPRSSLQSATHRRALNG
jgi:hypothetical protein